MKFGYFTDRGLDKQNLSGEPWNKKEWHPDINRYGYRCQEWDPMPSGKKNVVVLGCSHTFGEGLNDDEHWVHHISQHNTKRMRYWNLGQPGASADKIVRILYGCEKVIYPSMIIVCWPFWSRREKLHSYAESQMSHDEELKNENENGPPAESMGDQEVQKIFETPVPNVLTKLRATPGEEILAKMKPE